MRFGIFKAPASDDTSWTALGDICDAVDFDYEKYFCGVGTFTLVIPRNSLYAEAITVGAFLILMDGAPSYDGFIVKNILYDNDTLKLTGYDLNGLLLDRVTLYPQEYADKDLKTGSTEEIVKYYVDYNCVSSTDAERNFPKLRIAENQNRGIANDAASPRLECVADVVANILGAQDMGYRITPDLNTTGPGADLLIFEVYEAVDRTQNQSDNSRVMFSFGLGNVTEMKRETGVTVDKNTFYCELESGAVQRYYKGNDDKENSESAESKIVSGYDRREEYLKLGCELDELAVYAEHEIADRYRLTDSLEVKAGNPLDYGSVYNVGDIVTAYDRERNLILDSVISAAEIKRSAEEYSVKLTLGKSKPKLLDSYVKKGQATAATVRNASGTIGTLSVLTDYEYISDTSAKANGITYTAEKNNNGLISKISDSAGNVLEPTLSGTITDTALHNAVFWAVAMARGLKQAKAPTGFGMPYEEGLTIFDCYTNIDKLAEGVWTAANNSETMQTADAYIEDVRVTFPRSTGYGCYTSNTMPVIIYLVGRAGGLITINASTPVISKRIATGTENNLDFLVADFYGMSGTSNAWIPRPYIEANGILAPSRGSEVVPVDTNENQVFALVISGKTAELYANGVKYITINSENSFFDNYDGAMLIHASNSSGALKISQSYPQVYMIAFGTAAHTADEIAANSTWLKEHYGVT